MKPVADIDLEKEEIPGYMAETIHITGVSISQNRSNRDGDMRRQRGDKAALK